MTESLFTTTVTGCTKHIKKSICLYAVAALLLTAGTRAAEAQSGDDLKIWYSQPATDWLGAIPLGNGRIGAMALGGVSEERIILNESSLYSRESPVLDTLPNLEKHLDIIARMIKNGNYADAEEYATKHVTGTAVPCYQPLGDILFQFQGQDGFTDYTRELDLSSAVAKVRYQVGDAGFTREMFTSYPDNALIIRFKSDRKGRLNFNVRMESVHPTVHLTAEKKEVVFTGQLPGLALRRTFEWVEEWGQQWKYPDVWEKDGKRKPESTFFNPDPQGNDHYPVVYNGKGIKFEARLRILRCDGQVSTDNNGLRVSGAQEVVIAVAVASGFNGFDKDPVTEGLSADTENRTVLSALANKPYSRLLQNHVADYQRLFNRVSLQIPREQSKTALTTEQRKTGYSLSSDPSFAALQFQFGRYLLISSSREGGQPANLQGIWNVDIIPPWGSAYTTNINMQMNYWAAEATNLSECHEPVFNFLKEVSVTGSRVAREMYNRPGWVLHHNTSVWRGAHPVDWFGQISFWPMGGGWLCRHLWQHYQYTKDLPFLRETAYPVLKGAAEFYNAWLADDGNGHWVTPISVSPENAFIYIDETGRQKMAGMSMASSLDLAVIRELFQYTIEAENILHVDGGLSPALADKLSRLYPYQIGQRGQFLEYFKEFIESPPRHNTSPYYPLYPGDQFTLQKNSALAQSVKTLMLNRTDSRPPGGGWVGAWYVALWARLGEGDRTLPYIEALVSRTHQNLFSGGGSVFQIDANLGFTAAVTETLLQSHSGELNLLPALPGAWPVGTVKGLCGEGGFEVSMSWQEKRLTSATVKSKTAGHAKIRYGEKIIEREMKPGETLRLDGGLNPIK
ncbi:MAG: glycoside hydrolase family 95 protein [Tannerella sp.]|jgi:alpha-L-fucosidase 2|nr:glycoside hydrolase family 95 protein [Tannerella sp.]